MDLQIIDPLDFPEWDSLLLNNGNFSFFHSAAWARVLRDSYHFRPVYISLIEKGQFSLLMPFMEVSSPLTGKRGISLPFTDECRPFALKCEFMQDAIQLVINLGEKSKWKYIEWRGIEDFSRGAVPSEVFYSHDLNLAQSESELFSSLKDTNRRNIKKSIKEGINIKIDGSLDSLKSFYRLNCLTRRRHGLPPQPFIFFKQVFEHILSEGHGIIVSAFHSGKIIASSVFFHFGRRAIFKYGASDSAYQHLRPNNLVIWEAIKWYRDRNYVTLNLGRTELGNHGLLRFKRMWGVKERVLPYHIYNIKQHMFLQNYPRSSAMHKRLFSRTPAGILRVFGRLFYKHFG